MFQNQSISFFSFSGFWSYQKAALKFSLVFVMFGSLAVHSCMFFSICFARSDSIERFVPLIGSNLIGLAETMVAGTAVVAFAVDANAGVFFIAR
jgi:hypothetical protein